MSEILTVRLGERSYVIDLGFDVFGKVMEKLGELEREGKRVAVVTDENVFNAQGDRIGTIFAKAPQIVLPAGESTKSLANLGKVLDFLAAERLDRTSAVFAIGGGVIGDLAGFAAASYLRGIDFYQVPTTLLAMVDSSVGGKTGINIPAGKNLVGAFHQPRGVFISTGLLTTLPAREFAAGMAEVLKYGLLGDAELFGRLEGAPLASSSADLPAVIRKCCALKAAIVEADERELAASGGRALLNLGHTFGHAIEQVTGYGTYLHGEAVAVGLAGAARLSQRLGRIGADAVARVDAAVAGHGLAVRLREPLKLGALVAAMGRDKKVRAGALRLVLLNRIGEAATVEGVELPAIEAVWSELGAV